MPTNRPLRVFLCHSSNDKPVVRELYHQLRAEPWIQPWLDEVDILPGADWKIEIEKAVEASDAILVCLTNGSITKDGYVQRELRIVLDLADYKPGGTLFIIPVRLEECEPPRDLRKWQYADYFAGSRDRAFQRLLISLRKRAEDIDLEFEVVSSMTEVGPDVEEKVSEESPPSAPKQKPIKKPTSFETSEDKVILSNNMAFMLVPAGEFLMGDDNGDVDEKPQHTVDISYDYWMARFPVTNDSYHAYAIANGLNHPVSDWEQIHNHPVVNINWTDAMRYCQWLNSLLYAEIPDELVFRLPTEAEWEKAARGIDGRNYPWGNDYDSSKCNVSEGFVSLLVFSMFKVRTTSVNQFSPDGDSLYGCADMAGNVDELTHSIMKKYPYDVADGREDELYSENHIVRGGSYNSFKEQARCSWRGVHLGSRSLTTGFRIVIAPKLS